MTSRGRHPTPLFNYECGLTLTSGFGYDPAYNPPPWRKRRVDLTSNRVPIKHHLSANYL